MSSHIQGQGRSQVTLFPEVLDDFVSEDNPIRVIDAFVDHLDLHSLGFERVEVLMLFAIAAGNQRMRSDDTFCFLELIKAILMANGFDWEEMPPALHERFDAVIQQASSQALLDVKFWKSSAQIDDYTKAKVRPFVEQTGIQRVMFLNVLGSPVDKAR